MLPLVLLAAALGLVVIGVALISIPAGFIAAGLFGAAGAALFVDFDKVKGGDA